MVAQLRQSKHQHKRHGHHQKRTRHFLRVYTPYIPLTIIVATGLIFSSYWHPRTPQGVLAYATNVSVSDLLASTNQERVSNSVSNLSLNSKLNSAAQAKANDMVARNYWSHNGPDGSPWWTFITNAGYDYSSAGENLAYGYLTSSDAVTGWMNSPGHKANMLNSGFTEVGFGFANSENFNGSGEETVVVAEYATPLGGTPAVASAPSALTPQVQPQTVAPVPTASAATAPEPVPEATTSKPKTTPAQPASTQKTNPVEPPSVRVSRLQMLAGQSAPWLASMVSIVATSSLAILILRHGFALRRVITKSERYVLHHMVFDVTIISLIGLCLIISRTAGVIR